jgi:hypothetical protein
VSEQGSIRYDPATGSVAIRTNQPEQPGMFGPSLTWLVATQTTGAHFVGSEVVADWVDLEVSGS